LTSLVEKQNRFKELPGLSPGALCRTSLSNCFEV
jgi:hypothetical protein